MCRRSRRLALTLRARIDAVRRGVRPDRPRSAPSARRQAPPRSARSAPLHPTARPETCSCRARPARRRKFTTTSAPRMTARDAVVVADIAEHRLDLPDDNRRGRNETSVVRFADGHPDAPPGPSPAAARYVGLTKPEPPKMVTACDKWCAFLGRIASGSTAAANPVTQGAYGRRQPLTPFPDQVPKEASALCAQGAENCKTRWFQVPVTLRSVEVRVLH